MVLLLLPAAAAAALALLALALLALALFALVVDVAIVVDAAAPPATSCSSCSSIYMCLSGVFNRKWEETHSCGATQFLTQHIAMLPTQV